VSRSDEQGKHKTQLQSTKSHQHAQGHPANFVLIHHVFADTPSSTSEFLKAFGVLLEAPKKTGVVGRCEMHDTCLSCLQHDCWYPFNLVLAETCRNPGGTGICGRCFSCFCHPLVRPTLDNTQSVYFCCWIYVSMKHVHKCISRCCILMQALRALLLLPGMTCAHKKPSWLQRYATCTPQHLLHVNL